MFAVVFALTPFYIAAQVWFRFTVMNDLEAVVDIALNFLVVVPAAVLFFLRHRWFPLFYVAIVALDLILLPIAFMSEGYVPGGRDIGGLILRVLIGIALFQSERARATFVR